MGENNNGCSEEEDRLSSLPDALLTEILSRIPIKSAVVTSVLSRRWEHLWTHITRLSFYRTDSTKLQDLFSNVEHILRRITSPKLHSFIFILTDDLNDEVQQLCSHVVDHWIPKICARNPEEITLIDLRKLSISISIENSLITSFLDKLFKSCPILEELDLHLFSSALDKGHSIFEILVPNVKCLALQTYGYAESKFRIDAPQLARFKATRDPSLYHFVKRPSNLLRVDLDFDVGCTKDCVSNLCHGFSSVKFLQLNDSTLRAFNVAKYGRVGDMQVFPNLVHLVIRSELTEIMIWDDALPAFLLTKLQKVDVQVLRLFDKATTFGLVKYVLSLADVLEELNVSTKHHGSSTKTDTNDQLSMEYKLCVLLFRIWRVPPKCVIRFSGHYISTSSYDSDKWLPSASNLKPHLSFSETE